MTKRVAILQSNYIPWRGYFDFIDSVDEFILFDEVQYTRRDWRNRNVIKAKEGATWLTIPVAVKGKFTQKISEVEISDSAWRESHLTAIRHAYARAAHFRSEFTWLEGVYAEAGSASLSAVNRVFLERICERLGVTTPLTNSADYELSDGKTERLLTICKQAGATTYVSGPAAKAYIDETQFRSAGIALEWMQYDGFEPYAQLHGDFLAGVSIIDVLLSLGPAARDAALRRGRR